MLNTLPQIEFIPDGDSASSIVENISNYISINSCKNIQIDISFMNILDACYVSTICSTKHYIKYPDGKINWKISSQMVKEFNSRLDLGNASYET